MTADELARILRERASHEQGTVRNRLPGVVVAVRRHRTLTEIELACGPYRVVSSMEPARAEALALVPGRSATAVIEATTVAIERA
jgi:molybdopterin-binding protein